MRGEHPGLTEAVLVECLDVWLLEHLPGSTWRDGRVVTFRAHREAVHQLAQDLALFVWRIVEPRQQELGLKPPFGGPRHPKTRCIHGDEPHCAICGF